MDLRPSSQTEPFPPLRVLSVCTGTGGLELAIGLLYPSTPVAFVEGEAYPAANLVALMEKGLLDAAPIWNNVRTFDPLPWAGNVDLVVAGIPCVSWSRVGTKTGGQDERDLTGELVRIIDGVQPPMVFVENVVEFVRPLQRGVVGGFGHLSEGLHRLGYRVEEPRIESASRAGAPHQRNRAFIFAWEKSAHSHSIVQAVARGMRGIQREFWRQVANADLYGRQEERAHREVEGPQLESRYDAVRRSAGMGPHVAAALFPPGPRSGEWFFESPQPGILGTPDGPAPWVDRVRLLGNGVCVLAAARAFYFLVRTGASE